MNPTLKNILAVIAGLIIGGVLNMAIVKLGGKIITPPPGADFTTPEGLKAAMHLMEPKHFLMPFLAHALGTLVGAIIATLLGASRKLILAMIVAAFNFLGGLSMVLMVPSPVWFTIADLAGAYFPMAFIGFKLGSLKK